MNKRSPSFRTLLLFLAFFVVIALYFLLGSIPELNTTLNADNTLVVAFDDNKPCPPHNDTPSIVYIEKYRNITTPPQPSENWVGKAINNAQYNLGDYSFHFRDGDGSALFIDASKYDALVDYNLPSFVMCPVPKSGCTSWKQVLKRIKGDPDYANTTFKALHSKENNLEMDRLHAIGLRKSNEILYDPSVLHAVFVREPLERSLSAFLDKCIRSHWTKWWCIPKSERGAISRFDIFVETIINAPPIRNRNLWGLDYHWLPQNFICDLYKTSGRYHVYHSQNKTHRKSFLDELGLWQSVGSYGWTLEKDSELRNVSLLEEHVRHTQHASEKVFNYFTPETIGKLIHYYREDYLLFSLTIPDWVCDYLETDHLKQLIEENFKGKLDKSLRKGVQSIGGSPLKSWKQAKDDGTLDKMRNQFYEYRYTQIPLLPIIEPTEPLYADVDNIEKSDYIHHSTLLYEIRQRIFLMNSLKSLPNEIWPQKCFDIHSKDSLKTMETMTAKFEGLITALRYEPFGANFEKRYGALSSKRKISELFKVWQTEDKQIFGLIQQNVLFVRDWPRLLKYQNEWTVPERPIDRMRL